VGAAIEDVQLRTGELLLEQQATPPGTQPEIAYDQIRAHRKLLPKDVPRYEVANHPAEDLVSDYAEAMARGETDLPR
jgi:hypothetical protein